MNKNGPVVVIEDDQDDQYLFEQVFRDLNYLNQVIFFADGQQALDYLTTTSVLPFLILSDINMPRLASRYQCLQSVRTGFLIKPHTMHELEDTIKSIMRCAAPNNF